MSPEPDAGPPPPSGQRKTIQVPRSRIRGAQHALDQVLMLLEDEQAYASSLKTSRNQIASLLFILIGLTLYKLEIFVRDDVRFAIAPWSLGAVQTLVPLALLSSTIGLFYLFREPTRRRRKRTRPLRRALPGFLPSRRKKQGRNADPGGGAAGTRAAKLNPRSRGKSQAPLAVLNVDDETQALMRTHEYLAIKVRTIVLIRAHERLAKETRTRRQNIKVGRRWIFAALILLFGVMTLYLWGVAGHH